ncbi:hypothetical protein PUN28_002849 [Cardiocondyla obscurior]|uniref:Uncharacterized protein n=1 Tax=Cardiocondyla obscurior TaxID=286306 RepID=A0AAW2GWB0_9HYME
MVNLRVVKRRPKRGGTEVRKTETERFIERDIVVFRLHRTMDPFPERQYAYRYGQGTPPPSLRGRNFGCRRRHQDGNRKLDNLMHTTIVAAATDAGERSFARSNAVAVDKFEILPQ